MLSLQFSQKKSHNRLRVIFLATPIDESQKTKSVPDYESVRACWVRLEELEGLRLRADEPKIWFSYV